MDRVILQWTETAKAALAKLPKKVRRGLLDKANELRESTDPSAVHKPLKGRLRGYYRICYSRYRLIFTIDKESLPSGDTLVRIKITLLFAGIRKERDKGDVYRLACKLLEMGIIPTNDEAEHDDEELS